MAHARHISIYFLLLILLTVTAHAATGLDEGYRDMYNRDFTAAHTAFNAWIAAHPEDPLGPASDAAAYLFTEFERLDIVSVHLFNDPTPTTAAKPAPTSPKLLPAFNQRTEQP